jgi:hypothetical protein
VNAVAEITTETAAPTRRTVSCPVKKPSTRCITRNQKACAAALISVENRLTRTATESPVHPRSVSQVWARRTNSGFPGGCGIPRMCAVAMYSLVSQVAVVGASVAAYSANTAIPASAASRYGGFWWRGEASACGAVRAVCSGSAEMLMRLTSSGRDRSDRQSPGT